MVWMASAATTASFDTDTYDTVTVVSETASVYRAITPCRLLDTRTGIVPGSPSPGEPYYRGIYFGEIGSTTSQGANYTGTNNVIVYFDRDLNNKTVVNNSVTTNVLGDCVDDIVIGDTPTAIVANLTVTSIDNASYVQLYPYTTPSSKGYFSSITVYPGGNAAQMNNVVVPLAGASSETGDYANQQAFRVYNEFGKGSVNVIIDVVGYYYSQTVVQSVTGSDTNI
jgi:hypothetical protein